MHLHSQKSNGKNGREIKREGEGDREDKGNQ